MIASMTGFGKASVEYEGKIYTVEIRSVNSRYLDTAVRLPRGLYELEIPLREHIRTKINRGKVSINISLEKSADNGESLVLNTDVANTYFNLANALKENFDLPGEVDLKLMLSFPDLLTREEETFDVENLMGVLKKLLDNAIEDLNNMRYAEGQKLMEDFLTKIKIIDDELSIIEARAEKRVEEKKEKLREKIDKLMDDTELDEQRMVMEIVLLADKLDVTEECVRFRSHNQQFIQFLNQGGAVGKKLNFLLQEMHREANTIGSKANDSDLTLHVINVKEEIEKIREQIQNIE